MGIHPLQRHYCGDGAYAHHIGKEGPSMEKAALRGPESQGGRERPPSKGSAGKASTGVRTQGISIMSHEAQAIERYSVV